jgi:peroxiredoxin
MKLASKIRLIKRLAALALLTLSTVVTGFAQQTDILSASARDLNGRQVRPLSDTKAKAVVLFFVQTDCPISNRYAPEIDRLYRKFVSAGVNFWLIYPERDDTTDTVREHLKAYGYEIDALRDTRHELVTASNASVTPEAAIFVPSAKRPQLVYHGRIDDRVAGFGKTRPEPTTHDVEDMLTAILSGKSVTPTARFAFGCNIEPVK